VESKSATYHIEEQQIQFRGDVTIHLSGGTSIYAEEAGADLEAEQISIDKDFDFERGAVRGTGKALLYSIQEKTIEFSDRSQIYFSLGGDEGNAEANRVVYSSTGERILLSGDSAVRTPRYALSADEIEVQLSPLRRVTSLKSVGGARLLTGGNREFTGASIEIALDSFTGEPDRFEVLAGASGIMGTTQRAVFSEMTNGGAHLLEGDRIVGKIAERPNDQGFALSELTASENVVLSSSSLRIESCRAGLFQANFSTTHEGFEGITLAGDVVLVRRPYADKPSNQEVLRSETLEISLDPDQVLKQVKAREEVDLNLNRSGSYRHLTARDSVELTYESGMLSRAVASGDCVFRSVHLDEKDMVRAPSLDARFSEGQVERVLAEGGVDLEFIGGEESVRQTSSEELELIYSDGEIIEARQWGEFRFWDRTASASTELVSDQAVYDPVAGVITASGPEDSILRSQDSASVSPSGGQSETYAKQFVLNQKANRIVARTEVESVVRQNGEPLVLSSGRMEIDLESGRICYSESPRLIQGPNLIKGEIICLNNRERQLEVREQVNSLLVESEAAGGREYEIEADHLIYKNNAQKVTYTGDVNVSTEDLDLSAPTVDFYFASSELGELDRIEATGGVVILEKERTWKGRKAVYYRAEDRVVVTND
jgi:lipopolysaccharide export system protein LptA